MKTFKLIFIYLLAALLCVSCVSSIQPKDEPGKAGVAMGVGSARIVSPSDVLVKSQADDPFLNESQPVTVLVDPETGSFLSMTTTVSPMEYDFPGTRVTEVTTENLDNFTIDGYLGDEILTCTYASAEDKSNRHFINGVTVEKNTDGYWYFQGTPPQWRSCVDHHFWAYKGTPTGLAVSGKNFDQAGFSYTNTGAEDLVMGYQHQMWIDEVEGKVGSEDAYPLKNLKLRHAMAELVIDCSQIVMKMLNVNGGEYTDIPTVSDPENKGFNPRLAITEVLLLTPSKATCDLTTGVDGVQFDWDCPLIVDGNAEGYTTCRCDGTAPSSIFVIPQNQNGNVLVLNVYDSWRDITTPIFVEIPKLSDGTDWQPGYRYKYQITGTLVAPYCSPLGKIDPNFSGKNFQQFAVLKNLLSKYVRKVRLTWKGLPQVSSNDTPCAVIYLNSSDGEPSSTDYPMAELTDIDWEDRDNVGFVASVQHYGNPNEKVVVKKGEAVKKTSGYECSAEFIIPDNIDPPLTFYLLYDGDNGGNASWVLTDAKIEVVEFKYPIQVVP